MCQSKLQGARLLQDSRFNHRVLQVRRITYEPGDPNCRAAASLHVALPVVVTAL
jgi:hypothetical protein